MARLKEAQIGKVPADWEVAELRSFLERITYGFTNPMPTTEAGPWKVTAADIQNGLINYETARHTSQEAYEKELTDKSRPRVNDVLLTKDGSIGRIAVVDYLFPSDDYKDCRFGDILGWYGLEGMLSA